MWQQRSLAAPRPLFSVAERGAQEGDQHQYGAASGQQERGRRPETRLSKPGARAPVPAHHGRAKRRTVVSNPKENNRIQIMLGHWLPSSFQSPPLCPACRRNPWRTRWPKLRVTTAASCPRCRSSSTAWRSRCSRCVPTRSARTRTTSGCWASRPGWSWRLRPTGACWMARPKGE